LPGLEDEASSDEHGNDEKGQIHQRALHREKHEERNQQAHGDTSYRGRGNRIARCIMVSGPASWSL